MRYIGGGVGHTNLPQPSTEHSELGEEDDGGSDYDTSQAADEQDEEPAMDYGDELDEEAGRMIVEDMERAEEDVHREGDEGENDEDDDDDGSISSDNEDENATESDDDDLE